MKKIIMLLAGFFALIAGDSRAQTKEEQLQARKKYAGTWYCKKEKRSISIHFDDEVSYATINDWSSALKDAGVDAYKAFIEGSKLVLSAENDDHHAPYCQMEIVNHKLCYLCNGGMNFKDNFLNTSSPIDTSVFERVKQ